MHSFLWHYSRNVLDLVLVAEYPKSGGSWFCKMLSEASGLPNPNDHQFPAFQRSIIHAVYFYKKRFKKVICITRDGRDVMVSAYYHLLFKSDKNKQFGVDRYRKKLNFDDFGDIEKNMPRFIEFMFDEYLIRSKKTNWSNFNASYTDNPSILMIKYEDLLLDPTTQLKRALLFIGEKVPSDSELERVVERFSFLNMSKRKPGDENKRSFLRKGIAGDWKNKFSKESSKIFDNYAGDMLIQLGYEENHDWY